MRKLSPSSSFGHVFSSAIPWSVVLWCCFGPTAAGGQKAEVRSGLQSAADVAAQAGVSSLDCTTGGWVLSLQAVLDQLAAQEVPNEPGMSTNLAVNSGLVQVLDDADTPDNTWDKVLVWDYAASGRAGTDADKNLILRIRRGRYYPESGKGRKVFESMEHDHATNTGWVTANPNIPAFVAANAVLVELERPRVRVNSPKSRARAVYQSVKVTALAVAGPVDEVMVAPFAIPVCSLLNEWGEFQGERMAIIDRIFTEAARYCEGEGPNCNNYPMWPYTPCSCQYEQHGDEYLWSEENLRPLGASYYANYYSPATDPDGTRGTYLGDFDANPDKDYFCYHRMHWGGFGLFWDWLSGSMVDDLGNYIPGLPFKEWFSSNMELPFQGGNNDYPTYGIGWFGKTEIMASDHTGVVGLPERAEQLLGLSEDSVLSVIDGAGTVQARLGEGYHILPSGITQANAQERVWNQISNGGMADATHPAMDQTELGTIQKNHVEVTISSKVPDGCMGLHLTTHVGFLGHPDPVVEEQEWDWVNGDYIWDYGLCPSRRVKLQCATRGDDLCVTPKQGRLDVEWGAPAPEAANLTSWWDENEMPRIGFDGDEDPTTWEWSLSGLFGMFGVSDPRPQWQDYATYEEWELANAIWEYVQSIRWHWDRNGVVARLFVVPEDDVTDQTPVWKVKVPIIAVRGPDGLRCQDVDANYESPPGTVAWTDPVVDPSADWEVIGFVDMYVYDVSIGGISGDSVPPLSQSGYYDLPADTFPPQNAPGKDGYGPLPFYFFSEPGLDIGNLNNGEANIRPANAVRARITLATDFVPTSANEGGHSSQIVRGWHRR